MLNWTPLTDVELDSNNTPNNTHLKQLKFYEGASPHILPPVCFTQMCVALQRVWHVLTTRL